MKINNVHYQNDNTIITNNKTSDLTCSKEIKIFNSEMETNQGNCSSVEGNSATISIDNNAKNSIVPGFVKYNLTITMNEGQQYNVSIHVANNTNKELLNKTINKLMKVLSNANENILKDLGCELKHVLLTDSIAFNDQASAMAFGPLNQMFMSTEKLANANDDEFLMTITHELGHLIDCYNLGNATGFFKTEFNDFKKSITNNLGFKTDSHMFDNVREFFADYYAYTNGATIDTPTRKAKTQFDLLEMYNNDLETLSSEEFNSKYEEKADSVREIVSSWNILKNCFNYHLGNLKSGEVTQEGRADINILPKNFEQILEMRNKLK